MHVSIFLKEKIVEFRLANQTAGDTLLFSNTLPISKQMGKIKFLS